MFVATGHRRPLVSLLAFLLVVLFSSVGSDVAFAQGAGAEVREAPVPPGIDVFNSIVLVAATGLTISEPAAAVNSRIGAISGSRVWPEPASCRRLWRSRA